MCQAIPAWICSMVSPVSSTRTASSTRRPSAPAAARRTFPAHSYGVDERSPPKLFGEFVQVLRGAGADQPLALERRIVGVDG